jgi:general stress protein 26
MADTDKLNADPRATLFDQLDNVRAGMLGVKGADAHMQPMTHFPDRVGAKIWFITARDTDLAQSIGAGVEAKFTVVSADQDFHACVCGTLHVVANRAKLAELWSPMVGAWFTGGPDDPAVALLEFTVDDAAMWASSTNAFRFGYEIAKANLDGQAKPDVGAHVVHTFKQAA